MINVQTISNRISSDAVFTQLIDVANNINIDSDTECLIRVLNEATNETTIKYALKTIECLAKESANNTSYNPAPRNPEKVEVRVARIKTTSSKARQVKTMLTHQAKNKKLQSTTAIPYGGGKQAIDNKIKAVFSQMPEGTKTVFEGFGGGFNIPYIYSTIQDINPDIEYIITETNKTLVNLMVRVQDPKKLELLKRELAKIQAGLNRVVQEAAASMEVVENEDTKVTAQRKQELTKQASKQYFQARVAELNRLERAKKYNTRCAALYYYTMNSCIAYGYKMVDGISKMAFGKDGVSSQNIFAKLELFHKAFNKINLKILNKDYLAVSKTMNKSTTFVVFDPPYITDDASIEIGRKTQIYGLKSFDHQRCANEFKKYSSGMYFNNLNTEFKNTNLDMGNIEEWEREGKQTKADKTTRAVTEIFVTRDLSKNIGVEFNKEGYSDARLALRAIVAKIQSSKAGANNEAVSQNIVKTTRTSSKNNRKTHKTNKKNQILSKNKNLNIKSIRKFKLANATNNPEYTNNKSEKNIA